MNTAVINVKTEPQLKAKAQKVAEELGFSLSAIIKAYLKQLIKTKTVSFSVSEEPSEYLIQALKEAEEDRKKGKGSPTFDNAKDAIKWLKKQEK